MALYTQPVDDIAIQLESVRVRRTDRRGDYLMM
jgi:hypothetical protein